MISLFNFWVQDAHLEGWTPISKVLWLGRGFKMALRVSLDTEFVKDFSSDLDTGFPGILPSGKIHAIFRTGPFSETYNISNPNISNSNTPNSN
ncbi:hypothetical protein RIR_jg2181.t1 [Rhizophagus irregularis DAOM 181602=DAOM 197198]|nr:hypothetical protein RIR_jg2181.t1 [Rhizophagus irregularis DAOM 181602=DAOM 197198]